VQQDTLWRNPTNGDLGLWAMTGTSFNQQLTLAPAVATDLKVEGTADFNGDGNDDVLLRRQSNGDLEIRFMRGGEIIQTSSAGTASTAYQIAGLGDLDGDKKADIVWRETGAGQRQLNTWLMDGATIKQAVFTTTVDGSYKVEGIADLNADGKVDILWRNNIDGRLTYFLMNGGSIAAAAFTTYYVPQDFVVEAVRDLSGDGQADIFWRYTGTTAATQGTTIVWLNDASTATVLFPAQATSTVATLDYKVVGMRDWDADGKMDVNWRNAAGLTSLWLMDGTSIKPGGAFFIPGGTSANLTNPGLNAAGVVTRQRVVDEAGNTTALALDLGSLNGSGNYNGRVSGLDNNDYFKFTIGASTSVNLALTGLTGNADLQLLNSTGGVIVTSATAGTANESVSQTLVAGTYFARVYSAGNVSTKYQLSLSNAVIPTLLKDINSGTGVSNPGNLSPAVSTMYFAASQPDTGSELWKTDGTSAGTVLVKDIAVGKASSGPSSVTRVGTTGFFTATTDSNGLELWRTDGTVAGTVMVRDITSGTASSTIYGMTAVGNNLFFVVDDGINGFELWKSDGTSAGTVLVKDINPGNNGSIPSFLTVIGNTLYFSAKRDDIGFELWKSDGTSAGTVLLKDINPGSNGANPSNLVVIGQSVYFTANDRTNGGELWKSDGTSAGTVLVKDINPGAGNSTPLGLTAVGTMLYFIAYESASGYELWKSDGTNAGTTLVKDLTPGSVSSVYSGLTAMGNTLYFSGSAAGQTTQLWKSDGTSQNTIEVKKINFAGNADPAFLTPVGNILYFQAFDSVRGHELWRSDGTSAGTYSILNAHPDRYGSLPTDLTGFAGSLFYSAYSTVFGREIWKL
jgi:ELWxxDGT repeat protein